MAKTEAYLRALRAQCEMRGDKKKFIPRIDEAIRENNFKAAREILREAKVRVT